MTFPANIDLAALDGTDGFRISNVPVLGNAPLSDGPTVASGDVNGDGFADLIIGARQDDGFYGVTYVAFGKELGFGSFLDLSALDSSTGFRISHGSASYSGLSVAAGDVNGDGFDDILVGDPGSPYGSGEHGSAYVVFGKVTGFADVDLSTLDGSNGFRLSEASLSDETGESVAAGDLNGDGFADLVVGSPGENSAYVVFGKASGFPADLSLASLGSNGITISGVGGGAGWSVASAGDVNGDGFLDLIIGAPYADGGAGAAYVVLGSASGFTSNVDLSTLNGTNGFKVHGGALNNGFSVASAGDVNGDGFDDFIVGDPPNSGFASSFAYVVFGKASGFPAVLDATSLNGTNGFRVNSTENGQRLGWSVAAAGDLNGDGFDDVLVGAPGLYGDVFGTTGHAYVIYGKASGFAATFDPSSLNGTNGFTITGGVGDEAGFSVALARDLNGDGADDLIVGAASGASYVVYGEPPADPSVGVFGTSKIDILKGSQFDDTLAGQGGNDRLYGFAGDDVLTGGNGNDVLAGGSGDDTLIGGNGTDTAYYAAELSGVNASLATGKASGASTGHDTLAAIENLTGSSFNDSLTGDGAANKLTGLAGNDTLSGGAGADTMIGGTGNDSYIVDNAGDIVTELLNEGTDTVKTTLASYTLGNNLESLVFNGTGNFVGTGNGLGNTIIGGAGNDTLDGGGDKDKLTGGAGSDTLTGGTGADTLDGGTGADTMTGGADNDVYTVDDGGDVVTELASGGLDTVKTTLASYTLGADVENLMFTGTGTFAGTGNGLNNAITGGAGNDALSGGIGADKLVGGDGADTLAGGAGGDSLTGGAGIDTFLFDTAPGSTNIDTIYDFDAASETIALDHTIFAGLTPGALSLAQFSANFATGSGPQIVYSESTGRLSFDDNGALAGGAARFATVAGAPTLTAANFTVV